MLSIIQRFQAVLRTSIHCGIVAMAVTGCSSVEPDQPGSWGSTYVALATSPSGATLEFLASGGCYGSYGAITQAIPSGTFTLSGTYTQLMGVFPGSVQYPAEYVGSVAGRHMNISIHVAALQQVFGPYDLSYGVEHTWSACLYP